MTRGYLFGGFDLFHVGDLDVIRRARAGCDELAVGVATDDLFRAMHGRLPFVGESDRMQIVAHVRWVDRVVPVDTADVARIWQDVQFDVIFTDGQRTPISTETLVPLPGGVRIHCLTSARCTTSTKLRGVLELSGRVA